MMKDNTLALSIIEKTIYEEISKVVKEDNIEYPSINNFVNKTLKKEIGRVKK